MTLFVILLYIFYTNQHLAPKTIGGITLSSPRKTTGTSLQLVPVDIRRTFGFIHLKIGYIGFIHPKIGYGFVHPKIGHRHHSSSRPRRQPEASFIILVPVDNRRILDIICHWDPEDNRWAHLSFKSPKTTGGLIYHSSPRRQSEDIRHHLPLGPRRQPAASFIIQVPEDNRWPYLSFKSLKTTRDIIYIICISQTATLLLYSLLYQLL
ncbi:hypothetical protein H5410_029092 [Solanum commersonii]|uniref:Uncharacterized protein n=1 Tax=Solanum commersonii TaxID=4109 RepID=A0A9J5Z6N2_SOLCO|nr:hypothetical protein H5410_029092 [Solanum commersonii]